jgi:hypothetical protein
MLLVFVTTIAWLEAAALIVMAIIIYGVRTKTVVEKEEARRREEALHEELRVTRNALQAAKRPIRRSDTK